MSTPTVTSITDTALSNSVNNIKKRITIKQRVVPPVVEKQIESRETEQTVNDVKLSQTDSKTSQTDIQQPTAIVKISTEQPEPLIVFDIRESALIELFKKNNKVKFTTQNLPIGDILFNYGPDTIILIERKTVSDLNSSIQDGRYKEQKLRIMNSTIPQKYYLVEGSLKPKAFIDIDKVYSAVVHTTIRDKIPVIRTEDFNDTVKTLEKIYNTFILHGPAVINAKSPTSNIDYAHTLKAVKKDNLTPAVCYLSQLSQIPGVSSTIASRIGDLYPNFQSLVKAYGPDPLSDPTTGKKLLKDIALTPSRTLGPVVSARVYEYLFF